MRKNIIMLSSASRDPLLSIIVVSYNTKDLTLKCLASVYRETNVPFELIVVDNASTDGSAEAIAAEFPDVTLLAETVNHGFAQAHPIALTRARAPWLLLLNPDTIILDSALDKLLAFARRTPKAGIWGGRTLYVDRTLNPASCWARITMWSLTCQVLGLTSLLRGSRLFNPEAYGGWDRSTEREVDIVVGCLLLCQRNTWDALGGFDPVFVMYGEEADLCLRAKSLGYSPRVTPEATIVHYGGASEQVRTDKMVRLLKARVELIKRHLPPATRGMGRRMQVLWPLSRSLAFGAAAGLLAREDIKVRAEAWRDIWSRRAEWQDGFPDAETDTV